MDRSFPSEQSIFLVARQIRTDDERRAYLEQICGDNDGLRRAVEALLSADDASHDVLAVADQLDETAAGNTVDETIGAEIGPYKLLERIGEGGMGAVFMAEQREPVRRRVALKIIKPGMDSKLVIARFEAERQALALMDHQNIARVLDAGETSSGRPFFVMELVKGVPITEFCENNTLTLDQRLELLLQVCFAIHHSHQKGIIHRDIKPSNVLVCNYDGRPVPKVIDFGIAKATHQQLTEKTLFTQHGQVVGTLEYMSPEQAELSQIDIDTRSDIYSLGVMLYELLTGTTPITKEQIRSTGFVETLRVICHEEVERPSTRLSKSSQRLGQLGSEWGIDPKKLHKALRGELDWIIMRALEKDRERRYETVNAFAADIHRYLRNQPIEARPPSILYRSKKFLGRHRRVVSRLAVGLLLAVSIFLVWWNRRDVDQAVSEAVHQAEEKSQKDQQQLEKELQKSFVIKLAVNGQQPLALKVAGTEVKDAGKAWIKMLHGICELYKDHGASDLTLARFEEALQYDDDGNLTPTIKALIGVKSVWEGDWTRHETMLDALDGFEPDSEDTVANFAVGQVWMWTRPRFAVRLLTRAHVQWKKPPVVSMMLAEAYGHWAWASNNEDHIQVAMDLADSALKNLGNNASAHALRNWCYMISATLCASRDKSYAGLLESTQTNVTWMSDQEDYLIGYANRAWYFHLRDQLESMNEPHGTTKFRREALELWRKAVFERHANGWFITCYAAEMYRLGKESSQEAFVSLSNRDGKPSDIDDNFAQVFLRMDSAKEKDRQSAREYCIVSARRVNGHRSSRLQIMMWLRVGDFEKAKQVATMVSGQGEELAAYDVILGNQSSDEFLQREFMSQRVELNARLLVAVYQMAKGEITEAKATLEPAVKMGGMMVVADHAHWARALYERPFTPHE